MSKKVLFVTGTRADYGKLEPLARAAQTEGFEISFFVTGMHMMRRYGETRLEVQKFSNAEIYEFVNQREGDALDLIISKTILGFSDFVHERKPDLVVVHGDRAESLAVSIVCATRYILTAHIEGGESSGTIDESIRHCNSKLCATHFVSSDSAKDMLIKMGESQANIYTIGSPELDVHVNPSGVSINEVKRYYDIGFKDYGIVIFHPVTSELDTMADQAKFLFAALTESKKSYVVIAPNNDPGSEHIFRILEDLPPSKFRVLPSMRFSYFSELLKCASIVIGNSSTGVREAPFLGIPSINIGSRQKNRSNAESVFNFAAHNPNIAEFIDEVWGKAFPANASFGNGAACRKFMEVVRSTEFWNTTLQK